MPRSSPSTSMERRSNVSGDPERARMLSSMSWPLSATLAFNAITRPWSVFRSSSRNRAGVRFDEEAGPSAFGKQPRVAEMAPVPRAELDEIAALHAEALEDLLEDSVLAGFGMDAARICV